MRRRPGLLLLTVGLTALVFSAMPARAVENKSAIRYYLGYVTPSDEYKETFPDGESKATLQHGFGVGLGFEYLFTDTIGLDVAGKFFNPEIRVQDPGIDRKKRLRFFPVTVGPMFHFGGENFQFYAGPEVAYVSWGKISAPDNISVKSELTWGAKIGVDVPWNTNWVFNATLEYIDAKATIDQTGGVDLKPKPVIVTIGAAYRF